MNTRFMPELGKNDRIQAMQDAAAQITEKEYYVALTQEDLDLKREQFTDNSIWLGEEKEKLKEITNEYKERVKPKAEENALLLNEITTKQTKRSGILYMIPDYDNSMMVTYDEEGEVVESRRLRPEEKNARTLPFPKERTGS